jgi:hypothetical protein
MDSKNSLHSSLASLAALMGGLGVGYIDTHATEEVVTLGLMLALNLTLGVARTRGAWKYPALAALGAACWIWMAVPANPNLPHTIASFAELIGILMVTGAIGVAAVYVFRQLPRTIFR